MGFHCCKATAEEVYTDSKGQINVDDNVRAPIPPTLASPPGSFPGGNVKTMVYRQWDLMDCQRIRGGS